MKSNDTNNPSKSSLASGGLADNASECGTADMNSEVSLDAHTQAIIGQRLKSVYGEIVQQPVPDDLLRLLDQLAAKERR